MIKLNIIALAFMFCNCKTEISFFDIVDNVIEGGLTFLMSGLERCTIEQPENETEEAYFFNCEKEESSNTRFNYFTYLKEENPDVWRSLMININYVNEKRRQDDILYYVSEIFSGIWFGAFNFVKPYYQFSSITLGSKSVIDQEKFYEYEHADLQIIAKQFQFKYEDGTLSPLFNQIIAHPKSYKSEWGFHEDEEDRLCDLTIRYPPESIYTLFYAQHNYFQFSRKSMDQVVDKLVDIINGNYNNNVEQLETNSVLKDDNENPNKDSIIDLQYDYLTTVDPLQILGLEPSDYIQKSIQNSIIGEDLKETFKLISLGYQNLDYQSKKMVDTFSDIGEEVVKSAMELFQFMILEDGSWIYYGFDIQTKQVIDENKKKKSLLTIVHNTFQSVSSVKSLSFKIFNEDQGIVLKCIPIMIKIGNDINFLSIQLFKGQDVHNFFYLFIHTQFFILFISKLYNPFRNYYSIQSKFIFLVGYELLSNKKFIELAFDLFEIMTSDELQSEVAIHSFFFRNGQSMDLTDLQPKIIELMSEIYQIPFGLSSLIIQLSAMMLIFMI